MAVDDLYQMTVEMETAGSIWYWGFQYAQTSGSNDVQTLEELCTTFNGAVGADLLPCLGTDSFFRITEAKCVTDPSEIPGMAPPVGQQGSSFVVSCPANMAAKSYWGTTSPNSKHNGATNWSGVPISFQDGGQLTAPAISSYQFLMNTLDNVLTGVGTGSAEFTPCVISRWLDGVKRVTPVPYFITNHSLSSYLGNMRRRSRKGRQITT